jgi:DNA-binding NarL/FixJ family response regulator
MKKDVKLLSDLERNIIKHMADGHSYDTISENLKIPASEVTRYIQKMLHKQGFVSPYQLIHWAYQEAIVC